LPQKTLSSGYRSLHKGQYFIVSLVSRDYISNLHTENNSPCHCAILCCSVLVGSGKNVQQRHSLGLRAICFLACIPSGGALLAKVYGVASMQAVTLAVALPCCVVLAGIWIWAARSGKAELFAGLTIGFAGGFFGTVAYDVIRLPFHVAGQRVFAPIDAFGIWLADADTSSRFTEVIGWTYHYWNGIAFGLMYALFMRNRHWGWAIVWAFLLETIAVLSPFGRIFSLSGNYYAIGIAYLGHVAYGVPLGWLVYSWEKPHSYLTAQPFWMKWMIAIVVLVAVVGPLISGEKIRQDARTHKGAFRVSGSRLNPEWLRIERGGQIHVFNPEGESVSVRVKQTNVGAQIPAGRKEAFSFPGPGIYQLFVETGRRSQSSFVIVEPVEELQ
jgi:hypothetical protein